MGSGSSHQLPEDVLCMGYLSHRDVGKKFFVLKRNYLYAFKSKGSFRSAPVENNAIARIPTYDLIATTESFEGQASKNKMIFRNSERMMVLTAPDHTNQLQWLNSMARVMKDKELIESRISKWKRDKTWSTHIHGMKVSLLW